ncbi:hypothetical protein GCM10027360_10890 [Amycolatopsis echigonensis]
MPVSGTMLVMLGTLRNRRAFPCRGRGSLASLLGVLARPGAGPVSVLGPSGWVADPRLASVVAGPAAGAQLAVGTVAGTDGWGGTSLPETVLVPGRRSDRTSVTGTSAGTERVLDA